MVIDDVPDVDVEPAGGPLDPPRRASPERLGRLDSAAARALEEADARRSCKSSTVSEVEPEIGGRGGKDPVRYGDWEVRGLTSDF